MLLSNFSDMWRTVGIPVPAPISTMTTFAFGSMLARNALSLSGCVTMTHEAVAAGAEYITHSRGPPPLQ